MPLSIVCPACRATLPGVPDALAGKSIKCTHCGQPVAVPGVAAATPASSKPVPTAVPVAVPKPAPKVRVLVAEVVPPPPPRPAAKPTPPAPARRKPADDEDDRPSKRTAARRDDDDEDDDDDDDDRPRKRSRRRKEEPKKTNVPLLIGVGVGLLVLGIGGIIAGVVMLNPQPQTAKGTEATAPPTAPKPPVTPPTTPKEPPPEPPKEEEPPEPPKPMPEPPPVNPVTRRDSLSPEALATLKKGTVYIEVDDGVEGGSSGSGWFGGEAGLVITNAHVLGMLYPGAKPPDKITVYTDSGLKGKQKSYDGAKVKVLAVDREMDLAVLQIVGEKDLPPPLPVRPSAQLHELDKLVCFGFPGGRRLSDGKRNAEPPTVTVTGSAVSGFQNDDAGNLHSVRMQGGVVHGNSGGPITDTDGNVIGVAVRVDLDNEGRFTNIAFAVPSEYVTGLLAGRASDAMIGQGYYKGDRVVYPISVRCADAMARLKGVGVGVWVGDKGTGVRTGGDSHTAEKGDADYHEVKLTYDKEKRVATGEIDFPKGSAGRVLWAQPYYSNSLTAKKFLAGKQVPPDIIPVDRTPADLTPHFTAGTRNSLHVTHFLKVTDSKEKNGKHEVDGRVVIQDLTFAEQVQRARGGAGLELVEEVNAAGLKIKMLAGDTEPKGLVELQAAKDGVQRWLGRAPLARDGRSAGVPVGQVEFSPDVGSQAVAALSVRLGEQLALVVQETMVKLPATGKAADAGFTWTDETVHRVRWHPEVMLADPKGKPSSLGSVKEEVTYTYLGRRERAGRGEWVIKVEGVLRPLNAGKESATCGSVDGEFVLDEKTGMVSEGKVMREFILEAEVKGVKTRASGTELVKITRTLGK